MTCTCVTQAMCDAQFNFLFGVTHGSDAKGEREESKDEKSVRW